MATVRRFEDLEVWRIAREIENAVFKITKTTALSRDYKLIAQLNSSTGSIMDNIAEGFGRGSRLEFINFLSISKGSADELKSQLYRCFDRNYIQRIEFDELYSKVEILCRKLARFIDYLNKQTRKGQKFQGRSFVANTSNSG